MTRKNDLMTTSPEKRSIGSWFGEEIPPGATRNVTLPVSESYSSMTVQIPIQIRRAPEDGPVVFVTAALHGDEINGTGAVRQLINDPEFTLKRGAVILVPVVNILGFERFDRYLPDRRDLNRSFPGAAGGSLASRMARIIFDEIVSRSDYGIDLHTASVRRTNYPNVRGDLSIERVRSIAEAFGAEIIVDGQGPEGAFRREACAAGCPTIIMEGGEVWKVEPGVVAAATGGVKNVLKHLGMLDGAPARPAFQATIEKTTWIRADRGGFLRFHIHPGDLVRQGQALATNTTLLGEEHSIIIAPFDAVVIGMSSLPATGPGEAICHLGELPEGLDPDELTRARSEDDGLGQQISDQLSSNILNHDGPDRDA